MFWAEGGERDKMKRSMNREKRMYAGRKQFSGRKDRVNVLECTCETTSNRRTQDGRKKSGQEEERGRRRRRRRRAEENLPRAVSRVVEKYSVVEAGVGALAATAVFGVMRGQETSDALVYAGFGALAALVVDEIANGEAR